MRKSKRILLVSLYDIAVVIMSIKVIIDRWIFISLPSAIDTLLIVLGLSLFMVCIIFEGSRYLKEWICIIVIGAISLYASLRTHEYFFLMSIILIIASIGKDVVHTIKVNHIIKIIAIIISILWYFKALIIDQNTIYTLVKDGRVCHHFGFTHPNGFAIFLCWILIESVFLSHKDNKKLWCIPLLFWGYGIYYFTGCDTAMIVLSILAILIFISQYKFGENILYIISKCMFPFLAVINYMCIVVYAKKGGIMYGLVYKLDEILTARIRQAAWIYENYGISVLGQDIPVGKSIPYDSYYRLSRLMLDGMYSNFLLAIGIIFTIIISIIIWKAIKIDRTISSFIIVFSIYGFLETHGLNCYIVFPLYLLGGLVLNSYHKKLQEDRDCRVVIK